jgi:light-regulated signal transduction histidine kinase (bacteriophytochrome)
VVSHDLQAPLRAINNYVGFLKEDLASSLKHEQQEYLGIKV